MSKRLKKVPSLKNPNLSVPKPARILDNVVTVIAFAVIVLFVFLAAAGATWVIVNAVKSQNAPEVHNDTTVIANIDGQTRQFNDNIDVKYRDNEVLFTQNKKTYTVPAADIVVIEHAGARYTDIYPDAEPQRATIRISENDTITADVYEVWDYSDNDNGPGMILRTQDKLYKVSPDIVEFAGD